MEIILFLLIIVLLLVLRKIQRLEIETVYSKVIKYSVFMIKV